MPAESPNVQVDRSDLLRAVEFAEGQFNRWQQANLIRSLKDGLSGPSPTIRHRNELFQSARSRQAWTRWRSPFFSTSRPTARIRPGSRSIAGSGRNRVRSIPL